MAQRFPLTGSDRIVVPFLWVPDGETPDAAQLARLREPVRVPARFVPRPDAGDGRNTHAAAADDPQPRHAGPFAPEGDALDETGGPDGEEGGVGPEPDEAAETGQPSAPDALPADPVAAFLRVNAALGGAAGLGQAVRDADPTSAAVMRGTDVDAGPADTLSPPVMSNRPTAESAPSVLTDAPL